LDELIEIGEVVATCGMGVVEVIGEMAKSIEYGHVCSHVNVLFHTMSIDN
jgi:hypothetical protein